MTPLDPRSPQQDRSRRTLEKILDAAETALEREGFERLTMAALASRAGVAVGTIYTRFPTKEALLPALFERHDAAVGPRVAVLVESLRTESRLADRARSLVTFAVDYHLQRRGLLRALTHYVRGHPESVGADLLAARQAQYSVVADGLMGDGTEVRRDPKQPAVLFVLGVVNSVCREQLLFDDSSPTKGALAASDLVEHLTQLVVRTLSCDVPADAGLAEGE